MKDVLRAGLVTHYYDFAALLSRLDVLNAFSDLGHILVQISDAPARVGRGQPW
jgi:hypothetical protein